MRGSWKDEGLGVIEREYNRRRGTGTGRGQMREGTVTETVRDSEKESWGLKGGDRGRKED